MPYIDRSMRMRFEWGDEGHWNLSTPDILSYLFCRIIRIYLSDKKKCWDEYSDVLTAIDATREAFMEDVYRPYERAKKKENGDVF